MEVHNRLRLILVKDPEFETYINQYPKVEGYFSQSWDSKNKASLSQDPVVEIYLSAFY